MQYGLLYCYGTLKGPDYKLTYLNYRKDTEHIQRNAFIACYNYWNLYNYIETPCFDSLAIRQSPYTKGVCPNSGKHQDSRVSINLTSFLFCFSVSLSCGKSSAENCTFLVQSSTSGISSPCIYTICRSNSNICRIRFDFTVSQPIEVWRF